MQVNPGGIVEPSEVIGRDDLIERLWKILQTQGLVLSAERRIGKTTILKKMEAEPKSDFRLIYRDIEGCSNAADFATKVTSDINDCLTHYQALKEKIRKFWRKAGGTEVGGILRLPPSQATHWRDRLERSFTLLSDSLKSTPNKFIVLAWDEFPLLLKKIASREGENHAMDILDQLRALRNSHSQIRLIFTGSIGLHHIISDLKELGYSNSPHNNMRTVEVPPLAKKDAIELAKQLIQGEGLGDDPGDACAKVIADSVDYFPFYIHLLVNAMLNEKLNPTPENAKKLVDAALTDSADQWYLRHYYERLAQYYDKLAEYVRLALDLIAEEQPISLEQLLTQLRLRGSNTLDTAGLAMLKKGEDGLRKLLWRLLQDHYLLREADGCYRFKYKIIHSWWLKK